MPCDMCELAQQLPEGGQRGDLVAGNNIQATIAREMSRLPAPDAGHEIDLTFEKTALEELLKKHISTFRDVFRQYAREVSYEIDSRTRTITASIGTLEASHVLVVSPRHLMKLYRDCRMHLLRLDPCEVEEIYNEVKMHHAMANQFEDVQRFETGLSLEMFVEALLTFACRCQVGHLAIHAFHDKLDHIIEKHLVPFAGSKQDNVVYQLLVDEALDELIDDFSPRLRSIFVAFASAKDDKSEVRSHDRQRHRGAVVKATVASTNKQALTMSLENFTEMLQVAGLMSETIHRACVGRIYMNLQALRVPEDEEIDEDGASPSISEDLVDHLASLMEEDHAGASFQYTMALQIVVAKVQSFDMMKLQSILSLLVVPCIAQPDWCRWVPYASQQYVPDCSGYVYPPQATGLACANWCQWVPGSSWGYVPDCNNCYQVYSGLYKSTPPGPSTNLVKTSSGCEASCQWLSRPSWNSTSKCEQCEQPLVPETMSSTAVQRAQPRLKVRMQRPDWCKWVPLSSLQYVADCNTGAAAVPAAAVPATNGGCASWCGWSPVSSWQYMSQCQQCSSTLPEGQAVVPTAGCENWCQWVSRPSWQYVGGCVGCEALANQQNEIRP
eukprot:symbB.v1.2.016556.t1/scaffold1261.1/size128201/1